MPPDNVWDSTLPGFRNIGFRQFNQAITVFPTLPWLTVLTAGRKQTGMNRGLEEERRKADNFSSCV